MVASSVTASVSQMRDSPGPVNENFRIVLGGGGPDAGRVQTKRMIRVWENLDGHRPAATAQQRPRDLRRARLRRHSLVFGAIYKKHRG